MEKTFENKFYKALEDIFVWAEIQWKWGFINLMNIKSKYYTNVLRYKLIDFINQRFDQTDKAREECFSKLYNFFKRYFSETWSIYFQYTPLKENVYERVYSNKEDVSLFYKTHMLYYVKSEPQYVSCDITVENNKNMSYYFFFDVSEMQNAKDNQKKEVVFEFLKIESESEYRSKIFLQVKYSERWNKTKIDEILKNCKELKLDEETLNKAIRTYKKQNEVDYFINKNANAFLKEQFNLYYYDYLFREEQEWDYQNITQFNDNRVRELQYVKQIAFKIIDFISQFEDELVKIWNKPKFVRKSNYVLTLSKLSNNTEVIKELINHSNFEAQEKEWQELWYKLEWYSKSEILKDWKLNDKWQYLTIDTAYFEDTKYDILDCFENLDNDLDGTLVHSDNYQALNTLQNKYRWQVKCIYIDPPFNLWENGDFIYKTNYCDSSWMTLLENRLRIAKDLLTEDWSVFVRCDYNWNYLVRNLMNSIFWKENFNSEIVINRKRQSIWTSNKLEEETERLYFYVKNKDIFKINNVYKKRNVSWLNWWWFLKQEERNPKERIFFWETFLPPKWQHFSLIQEKCDKLSKEHYIRLKHKPTWTIIYYNEDNLWKDIIQLISKSNEKFKYLDLKTDTYVYWINSLKELPFSYKIDDFKIEYLPSDNVKIWNIWTDIVSYSSSSWFSTENAETLLQRVIETSTKELDLVLDFFMWSATTQATAMKLKRKFIWVEFWNQFYDYDLSRLKEVLYWKQKLISKDVKHIWWWSLKYYTLEQYEEVLEKVKYSEEVFRQDLFAESKDIFNNYIFLKDSKLTWNTINIDVEKEEVKTNLNNLYDDIDIWETLSNLLWKKIKKLYKDKVIFENDEIIYFENIDYNLVKPLIWWK